MRSAIDKLAPFADALGALLYHMRSSLAGHCSRQVARIVRKARFDFQPLANVLIHSIAITARASTAAIRDPGAHLFSDVSQFSRYDLAVFCELYHRSPQERVRALLLNQIAIVTLYWSREEVEPHYDRLVAVIAKGMEDASQMVRKVARDTFCSFSNRWKDRLNELADVPKGKTRDLLLQEKAQSEIVKAIAAKYSRRKGKGPSTSEHIAKTRKLLRKSSSLTTQSGDGIEIHVAPSSSSGLSPPSKSRIPTPNVANDSPSQRTTTGKNGGSAPNKFHAQTDEIEELDEPWQRDLMNIAFSESLSQTVGFKSQRGDIGRSSMSKRDSRIEELAQGSKIPIASSRSPVLHAKASPPQFPRESNIPRPRTSFSSSRVPQDSINQTINQDSYPSSQIASEIPLPPLPTPDFRNVTLRDRKQRVTGSPKTSPERSVDEATNAGQPEALDIHVRRIPVERELRVEEALDVANGNKPIPTGEASSLPKASLDPVASSVRESVPSCASDIDTLGNAKPPASTYKDDHLQCFESYSQEDEEQEHSTMTSEENDEAPPLDTLQQIHSSIQEVQEKFSILQDMNKKIIKDPSKAVPSYSKPTPVQNEPYQRNSTEMDFDSLKVEVHRELKERNHARSMLKPESLPESKANEVSPEYQIDHPSRVNVQANHDSNIPRLSDRNRSFEHSTRTVQQVRHFSERELANRHGYSREKGKDSGLRERNQSFGEEVNRVLASMKATADSTLQTDKDLKSEHVEPREHDHDGNGMYTESERAEILEEVQSWEKTPDRRVLQRRAETRRNANNSSEHRAGQNSSAATPGGNIHVLSGQEFLRKSCSRSRDGEISQSTTPRNLGKQPRSSWINSIVVVVSLLLGCLFAFSGLLQAAVTIRDSHEYHQALLTRVEEFESSIADSYDAVKKLESNYALWSEYIKILAEEDEANAAAQLDNINHEVEKWQLELKLDLMEFRRSIARDIDAVKVEAAQVNHTLQSNSN